MKILTVTFCLLPALSWSEVIEVTGHEGQDVTVQCSHSLARSNGKYFCKGHRFPGKIFIKTEEGQRNKKKGRFSLYDDGTGTFWVTITGLKKTDTGTYWCAVDRRFIADTFTEVYLTVLDAPRPTAPPPGTSASNWGGGQTTGTLLYVTAGVSVALLLCGLIVVKVYKQRRNKILQSTEGVSSNSENANMDHTGIPGGVSSEGHRGKEGQHTDGTFLPGDLSTFDVRCGDENCEVQLNRPAGERVVFLKDDRLTTDLFYENLNFKSSQKESLYQSLSPSTTQKDSIYHTLNPAP